MAKWDVPAGAMAPDGLCLARVPSSRMNAVDRYHIAKAEPYASTLCRRPDAYPMDFAAPRGVLCTECAKVAGIAKGADLPVDADTAEWWAAQA